MQKCQHFFSFCSEVLFDTEADMNVRKLVKMVITSFEDGTASIVLVLSIDRWARTFALPQ